jgi:hypothetical protein
MMRSLALPGLLLFAISLVAYAQQTSSLSADDAQSLGLNFFPASGWQQGVSDPYTATIQVRGISVTFSTELYSASIPGAFDTETTEDVLRDRWRESAASARVNKVAAASADGIEVAWPGSRMERWFRISNDRFLVERCLTNGVSATLWASAVRPACDAQFDSVVLTASTLPPAYRAAEPKASDEAAEPETKSGTKSESVELARIPGGRCGTAHGNSETARAAFLVRHGERADSPADQFACWEAASELGSADAMTKIGQLFLERDQVHQSEQDRMAGVVWLLVAADRYHTLIRGTRDPEVKERYQQRFNTIMDLVSALKSGKLSETQFSLAVSKASAWKRSNMQLFR